MTPYLTRTVPRDSTAPWELRNALDSLWREVPPSTLPTARLLVSELATNAIQHGQGDTIRLAVLCRPRSILVEVVDDGPGFDPGERQGMGLQLVDTLAGSWGVEEGSARIWFELAFE